MKTFNPKYKDNIVMILLGIILGFLGFLFYNNLSHWAGFILIFADICVLAIIAYFAFSKQSAEFSKYLTEITSKIKKYSSGEQNTLIPFDNTPETSALYEAVEGLSKKLKKQIKSKDTVLKIVNTLALNNELEKLLDELLPKINEGTKSDWCAFYLFNNNTGKLQLKSSVGFSKNIYNEFDIDLGEGFIGTSSRSNKIEVSNDIPDDTIYISRTFLGKIKPKSIMNVPITSQGELVATLLLASIYNYKEEQIEIVKMIRYYLGVAVTNGVTFERTQRFKNELQFQNSLIQNLNDELELKVNERTSFLNAVVDSITDYAIFSFDKEGYITVWNKASETMFGYLPEEIIGKHARTALLLEEDFYESLEQKLMTLAKDETLPCYALLKRKDGKEFHAEANLAVMRDQDGNIIGCTSMVSKVVS